jgi:hypothetical protein
VSSVKEGISASVKEGISASVKEGISGTQVGSGEQPASVKLWSAEAWSLACLCETVEC